MNSQTKYGTRVTDALRHQTIWVKPQDILGAVCRDHHKCAVARAIKRQLGAKWVDVGASVVTYGTSKKNGKRLLLPASARKQIRFFDENAGAMAPCKMRLAAPSARAALGSRTGKKARSGKSSKRKERQQPTR
jgi:hypothetical protein